MDWQTAPTNSLDWVDQFSGILTDLIPTATTTQMKTLEYLKDAEQHLHASVETLKVAQATEDPQARFLRHKSALASLRQLADDVFRARSALDKEIVEDAEPDADMGRMEHDDRGDN